MEKLSKIVASKLAQGTGALPPSAVSHPDPDLLTAFVECSLPEWERVQVVGHLAECTRCRDVVALAQPELVTSSPALPVVTEVPPDGIVPALALIKSP